MVREMELSQEQVRSAADIQTAIDALGHTGGTLVLPEIDLVLDRGLELRSGITLKGQGAGTILRMAPSRIYPLSGYHNYGMCDAPLEFADGLQVGMTVAVRDAAHRGFFETLARITWVRGNWVGLDTGLDSDYNADEEPQLITSYPLVFGRQVEHIALRDLVLDGGGDEQTVGIGSCRGAAVYFIGSHHFEVTNVVEAGFRGEGLGFQMCSHGLIRNCVFERNTGNGYHPGAGSTGVVFEDCVARWNDAAGFFFCVRANHITVRNCVFEENVACGVSVGTRDCHNAIQGCRMIGNEGPGILFREAPRPVEVHSCLIEGCAIEGNASATGRGQVDIRSDAHDLVIRGNRIVGQRSRPKPGIYVSPAAERIWLKGNEIIDTWPAVIAPESAQARQEPLITVGADTTIGEDLIHLPPSGRATDE